MIRSGVPSLTIRSEEVESARGTAPSRSTLPVVRALFSAWYMGPKSRIITETITTRPRAKML